MTPKSRCLMTALVSVWLLVGWGEFQSANGQTAADQIPRFEYDPAWPRLPLPNEWILGEVGGISVDARGHIWVIHRPWTVTGRELGAVTGQAACCRPEPSSVEVDAAGELVQAWPELQSIEATPGTPAGQGNRVGPNGATLWESVPGGYGNW